MRALVLSWPSIQSPSDQRATESLVAWRIDQVRGSLAPNALSALERDDLLDALDGLAQATERAPSPHAESAVRRLREELEKMRVAPLEIRGWPDIQGPLRAHLGIVSGDAKLRTAFEGAKEKLRAQIDVAFGVVGADVAEDIRRLAAARLARSPDCPTTPSIGGMRLLAPPPERAWACAAVHAAARGDTETEELTSLVVLHDLVCIGAWSLDLHTEMRDPDGARKRSPLLSRVDDARSALLLREAATHPVGPIGGAATIVLLLAAGPAHLRERALLWRDFGDAPLDVVMREVFQAPIK